MSIFKTLYCTGHRGFYDTSNEYHGLGNIVVCPECIARNAAESVPVRSDIHEVDSAIAGTPDDCTPDAL